MPSRWPSEAAAIFARLNRRLIQRSRWVCQPPRNDSARPAGSAARPIDVDAGLAASIMVLRAARGVVRDKGKDMALRRDA
ncbi:MAG: hypothetical protein E6833_38390, partial [Bradyrhizobium sp.]|nr:hypothetical protein [Bradyrhizobium sp.]